MPRKQVQSPTITEENYWKLVQVQAAVFVGKVRAIGRDFGHIGVELPAANQARIAPYNQSVNQSMRQLVTILELLAGITPPVAARPFHRRMLRTMARTIKMLNAAIEMANQGRYNQLSTLSDEIGIINDRLSGVLREAFRDHTKDTPDLKKPPPVVA